jgi:RNA polymerase sigma-70 factor (ECF subfamily)
MSDQQRRSAAAPAARDSFDDVVLPHLRAAYRLARLLMRNEHDADDVVQDASLRAFQYFRTFVGGNGRAWFLRIVRNACGDSRRRRLPVPTDRFDEERHSDARPPADPESLLLRSDVRHWLEQAMGRVSARSRALLVLRELEGLSYKEMADEMAIPVGTVMSGLSRARQALRAALDSLAVSINEPVATEYSRGFRD